jgi:Tfp pilus assembly protein FimV
MNIQEKHMHAPFNFSLSRSSLCLGLVVCALTGSPVSFAAEPSNTAAPATPASAASASAAPAAPAPLKYTVREGDTLDKVIRLNMGNSPLRIEILREAVIKQNPQAFSKGSNKVLLANAVITLPNHNELLQKQLMAVLPPAEPVAPPAATSSYAEDRRKSWVRYP